MKIIGIFFLLCALYTPMFWLISYLNSEYGSIDNAPIILGGVAVMLAILPILIILNFNRIFGFERKQ